MRVPLATYRLQFNRDFRFEDARRLVPYLDALGISDLYASPLVQARRGSPHGYDVTDPSRLNDELGPEADFTRLTEALRRRGLGLLLDIVPNHMAASSENPWWHDVLDDGLASPHAALFDINWRSPRRALRGRILLPILDSPYDDALEGREICVAFREAGFVVRYHQTELPLRPASYRKIFDTQPLPRPLATVLEQFDRLPVGQERPGAKQRLQAELWRLYGKEPSVQDCIDRSLTRLNGRRGDPASFDHLDALLAGQVYRLAFWRTGSEELNYRRFFDISDLVSLRVEDPAVFEARHTLLWRLVREGKVTGVRVDHIDGLYDPTGYLQNLQRRLSQESRDPGFYLVVEKILLDDEQLPANWSDAAGTTGYDFLNILNRVLVDLRGERRLENIYARWTRNQRRFSDVVYEAKKEVIASLFPSELRSLSRALGALADDDRQARDLRREDLTHALVEVTACLPVYRTYTREVQVDARTRRVLDTAVDHAARRNPHLPGAAFAFLHRALRLDGAARLPPAQQTARLEFVGRWQQFAGPVMAKGCEDTALYVHVPLASLNEVGGDPDANALGPGDFAAWLARRAERWPATLNATATHDTKRGEDVRTRLAVLSELPRDWERRLQRWSRLTRTAKRTVAGHRVPTPTEEALLYQTLLGAWPLGDFDHGDFRRRIQDYVVKAAREAKVHTRWRRPHDDHEQALRGFVETILRPGRRNAFLRDFLPFQQRLAFHGALNGLTQVLLKIVSPGVPDFYQGTELWDLRLVDPDNRHPVDFDRRRLLLESLQQTVRGDRARLLRELLTHWTDGRIKLYLIWKALTFRRQQATLFRHGTLLAPSVRGRRKDSVCAFARRHGNDWALAVGPRLTTRLTAAGRFPLGTRAWGRDILLLPPEAPTRWRNILTGETVEANARRKALELAQVLATFPAALLAGQP